MNTTSTISIIYKDYTAKSITCNWDGYLNYNGAILANYYKDEKTVDKLVSLGNLSTLGKIPDSTTESWTGAARSVATKAYKDNPYIQIKNQNELIAKTFASPADLFEYLDKGGYKTYNYLFVEDHWYYWRQYELAEDMHKLEAKDWPVEKVGKELTQDEWNTCLFGNPAVLNNK